MVVGRRTFLSKPRWWRERNRSWWWSTTVVVVPIVVLTTAAVLVLMRVVDHSTPTARLEMIKVALAVGAGTGAALTLVLARRRQWATEHDAAERRLTELYVKAVEQLGSEQAAVRHGGLYALERVAQDNPDHRQTVVDVMCAYLRAPYSPLLKKVGAPRSGVRRPLVKAALRRPTTSALARQDDTTARQTSAENSRVQEREVRLTAQRILTRHLRPRDNNGKRLRAYWPGIDLDLNDATLINFNLYRCKVDSANFSNARFVGNARFGDAQFGKVWFDDAQFTGSAFFMRTRFTDYASFDGTQFEDAQFTEASFTGDADFVGTWFTGDASFDGTQFTNGIPASLNQQLPAIDA